MKTTIQRPRQLLFISVAVFVFGLMMIAYWSAYVVQGMPLEGIPLASELGNATVALVAACGLFRMKRWGYSAGLVLAGMWIYGVVGGIQLVMTKGLDFSSPMGALTDAIMFVLVLAFSIYVVAYLWRKQELFTQ
jgi:hypothetical protein